MMSDRPLFFVVVGQNFLQFFQQQREKNLQLSRSRLSISDAVLDRPRFLTFQKNAYRTVSTDAG
jgi:hypothetical protein